MSGLLSFPGKKKYETFASGDINVRKFGKSAKNFYRKKIQLQLSKSGGFLIKFQMGNRRFFSLKILSDEAQVI